MNIRRLLAVLTILLVCAGQSAYAVTWNFGALAANDPPAPFTGEGIFPAVGITISGVTLHAEGSGNANSIAYMDGPSGGQPAGLGVCSTAGGCEGSPDDNFGVTGASGAVLETLKVWFGEKMDLTYLVFRDGDHDLATGRRFSLSVDGGAAVTYTIGANGTFDFGPTNLYGSSFEFQAIDAAQGVFHSLYIESLTAVPEPAIVMLMGLGLLGLGFARRKTQQGS